MNIKRYSQVYTGQYSLYRSEPSGHSNDRSDYENCYCKALNIGAVANGEFEMFLEDKTIRMTLYVITGQ